MGLCGSLGPKTARVAVFCRTMVHETGREHAQYLAARARERAEE
jgi:hypothetical protein